jgi:hypothetical protein
LVTATWTGGLISAVARRSKQVPAVTAMMAGSVPAASGAKSTAPAPTAATARPVPAIRCGEAWAAFIQLIHRLPAR